jgi:diketogulonate reductase-like aldo/keto reductase
MNDDKTDLMVYLALKEGGFRAIDTANHYRNHAGVARGVKSAYRDGYEGDVWLQTKVHDRERAPQTHVAFALHDTPSLRH